MAGAFYLDSEESRQAAEANAETPLVEASTMPLASPVITPADTAQASTQPQQQAATLMIPVLNVSAGDLIDNFSDERGGNTQLHEAIDIAAEVGTSVVAAAPGTVERQFRSDVGGNTVYVRAMDGETIYYYAHLDEYAPGLTEGMQVRRGQRLGTVGATGSAEPSSPHLHFEVMRTTPEAEWWEPAVSVNPYPLLMGRTQP